MEQLQELAGGLARKVPKEKIPHLMAKPVLMTELKSGDPKTDIDKYIINLAHQTAATLEKQANEGLLKKTATEGYGDEIYVTYRGRKDKGKRPGVIIASARVSQKGEVRAITIKSRGSRGETNFTEINASQFSPKLTQAEISPDGNTQTLAEWGSLEGKNVLARRVVTTKLAPQRGRPPHPFVQVEAKYVRGGTNFLKLTGDHIRITFGDKPVPVAGLFGDLLEGRAGTIATDIARDAFGKEYKRTVGQVRILSEGSEGLHYKLDPTHRRFEYEKEGGEKVTPRGEFVIAYGFALPARVKRDDDTFILRPAEKPYRETSEGFAGSRDFGQISLKRVAFGTSSFPLYDMPRQVISSVK